jgi:N-acetylglucosaminyl-diphospho-decaprenol L-rhamnosyltransferase
MSYVPDVLTHHRASRQRDPHLRRRHGIRNTLWFTWLRRPLPSAAVRTVRLLRRLPRDRVSAQGIGDALRGLPWVPRGRDPVPGYLERGYRQLEEMQLNGGARKYVS